MADNAKIYSSATNGTSWTTVLTLENFSYFPTICELLTCSIFCFYLWKDGSSVYNIRFIQSFDSGNSWSSPVTKINNVVFGSLGLTESLTGLILLTYWKTVGAVDKQFVQQFGTDGSLIGSPVEIT